MYIIKNISICNIWLKQYRHQPVRMGCQPIHMIATNNRRSVPVHMGWILGQLIMRGHVFSSHPTWLRGSKAAQGPLCYLTSCHLRCEDCPSPRWRPPWFPPLLTHLIMPLPDQDLMGKALIFNCQEEWGNSLVMFAFWSPKWNVVNLDLSSS